MEYELRAINRFIQKKSENTQYQILVGKFLKQLASKDRSQIIELSQSLKKELIPLKANPYERRSFNYLDILAWLDSKIENRSIEEIIKERI